MRRGCLLLLSLLLCPLSAEKIRFTADSMTGMTGDKSDYTRLSGNAKVITESMEIEADIIELTGENFRYIKANGNVQGVNKDSHMDFTCQQMDYDRDTKIATLKSTVHLIDNDNDVVADAELIDYNQNVEIAILQIGVTLKQKNNVCTAAYAIYRKEDQLLTMNGNPQVVQGEDTFRAQEITLNLDTQEITLDGRVRGNITTSQ